MKRNLFSTMLVVTVTLLFAMPILAAVPAPPVNQNLGLPDVMFNAATEADCRVCHSTNPPPGIPVDNTYLPDRHHLNVGTTVPLGYCADNPMTTCQVDADCTAVNDYCIADSQAPNATLTSPASGLYECLTCHTLTWDPVTMTSQFAPFRDCTKCHIVEFQPDHPDRTQEANVHHRAGEAPKGNCAACHGSLVDSGLIDTDLDGFADTINAPWVPTYQPSLVTPWPSGKNFGRCDETCDNIDPITLDGTCSVSGAVCQSDAGCLGSDTQCVTDANCSIAGEVCNLALMGGGGGNPNARGTEEGNCNYCHDSSTTDTCNVVSGTCNAVPATACQIDADCNGPILINHDTHHFTGATGLVPGGACWFCHPVRTPTRTVADMRACETCHGIPSLHNIQVDSQPDGSIDPGAEDPWFGHIGSNSDCNGCHGFTAASAPGSGPVVPNITNADYLTVTAGSDKTVTLTGAAFTNTVMGTILLTSEVELTASDGSVTALAPVSVTESEIVVTLPGSLTAGNYDLRATKGSKKSNPVVVSVTPAVMISATDCNKKKGVLTITGAGFVEKPEGTDDYIGVMVNGENVELISWADTSIKASVSSCSNKDTVTVNALYGSATSGSSKPPKPCKGKGCNK